MSEQQLTDREISALQTSIEVAWCAKLKPKSSSERELICKDAKAALAKIKAKGTPA